MSEDETSNDEFEDTWLGVVRRDPNDKMLAQVVAVDPEDEGSELKVTTQTGETEGWDKDRFAETFSEHVIRTGEVWRSPAIKEEVDVSGGVVKATTTHSAFVGADYEIIEVNAHNVTFRALHIPLANDSDRLCELHGAETERLELFLTRAVRVAANMDEYDNEVDTYSPTAEDRAGVAKLRAELHRAIELHGSPPPDLVEKYKALGVLTPEELDVLLDKHRSRAKERGGSSREKLKEVLDVLSRVTGMPPEAVLKMAGVDEGSIERAKQMLHEGNNEPMERTESMDNEQSHGKKVKKLTANDFKEVAVVNAGHQVVLPQGMTKRVAIEWLTRADKEDERTVAINHEMNAYPIEGAYALYRALKDKYGFVSLESTPSFGEDPPRMVGLQVSLTERVQVPWGRIAIPKVSGFLETGATLKPDGSIRFVLQGEVKRRDEQEVNDLVKLVEHYATKESIYKGKAVRVRFPERKEDFDFRYLPEFIDTRGVDESELVFPGDVADLVNVALFLPIERTQLCRSLRIPLKRGILLEGPYGVGKTLSAYVTAKKCEANGWTFLYLEKTADLKQAIRLAQNYQPCVIFAEDIDQALRGAERDAKMNDILNTVDGIDSKSTEILVVLTTNHVAEINRAMLRPGRLDAVIPVRAPDAKAAIRLVRNYLRGMLVATDEEMVPVGEALAGQIPAVIREAVERGKLSAIAHLPADATRIELRPNDILIAATSMKAQLEYMQAPQPDTRTPIEKAAQTLADGMSQLGKGESGHATNGKIAAGAAGTLLVGQAQTALEGVPGPLTSAPEA